MHIVWIQEDGEPRVLAVMDAVFASTGVTHRNTYDEFEKIVGKTNAEAALRRYFREQDAA
jgi:YD repeat-containing protein